MQIKCTVWATNKYNINSNAVGIPYKITISNEEIEQLAYKLFLETKQNEQYKLCSVDIDDIINI